MASNHVLRSVLLAAGVLLMAACASKPASAPDTEPDSAMALAQDTSPLIEKKFQRAVKYYDQKYQYEGQVVYCKRGATRSMPPTECITESALRRQLDDVQRTRNAVQPPFIGTVGSIG